jgi:hypothetical protein
VIRSRRGEGARTRRAEPRNHLAAACFAALVVGLGSCVSNPDSSSGTPQGTSADAQADDRLAPLHEFEHARIAAADFRHLPTSDAITGADPIAVRALPGTSLLVGLLRGRDAIVVLDADLHEIQRLEAPASPTGITFDADGHVFVSGERSGQIQRYRVALPAGLERSGSLELTDVRAIRDVAFGAEGALYVVEEHDGRLITLTLGADDRAGRRPHAAAIRGDDPIAFERSEAFVGLGAMRVLRVGDRVLVGCLLDHRVVVRRVDARGRPEVEGEIILQHDGPIWSFDAKEIPGGLLVAAGGVEDHPLDRTGGSFGYIDSFAFLYRLGEHDEAPTRLQTINVSEHGVITPKVVRLEATPEGTTVMVTGYGGDHAVELGWGADPAAPARVVAWALPPGTTSAAVIRGAGEKSSPRVVFADPLLDAWIASPRADGPGPPTIVPAAEPQERAPGGREAAPRSVESKVGEALFFTSLMAPHNRTDGPLSRFTCETCHFEGYVDGRTHHTGRGDVRATTKPLLGLFNNAPHFSRALDPDLTTVAHSEFRVAGALSGHDPWFSVEAGAVPWLDALGAGGRAWSAIELRQALMTFLMDFTHRPNPAVIQRAAAAWTATERAGAEVFRDHCESCHAARFRSNDPASRVPFESWERVVMAREGAIVWAEAEYRKTGIVPYVHAQGARVPSLRRLYKKRPYFTNGSARDLAAVLERARVSDRGFLHGPGEPEGGDPGQPLDEVSRRSLLAFLDLL